jgi:hypothetical protein
MSLYEYHNSHCRINEVLLTLVQMLDNFCIDGPKRQEIYEHEQTRKLVRKLFLYDVIVYHGKT